jgi:aryl-alcohol dehydrogenase-like predicted oxidoreductase
MTTTTSRLNDLEVSPIGFGCMALSHVYGGTTDDDARTTLGEGRRCRHHAARHR